jgi:hypothetical protein
MDIFTSEAKEVVLGLGKALNDENYEAAQAARTEMSVLPTSM